MNIVIKKMPQACPSCDSRLNVKKLVCQNCDTEVDGTYPMPLLASFSDIEQEFIINFIKTSGSLKEMASIMNRSYPSVRNYLDELITKLNNLQKNNNHGN